MDGLCLIRILVLVVSMHTTLSC
jgi:hypothetical protein